MANTDIDALECELHELGFASGVMLSLEQNIQRQRRVAELTREIERLRSVPHQPAKLAPIGGVRLGTGDLDRPDPASDRDDDDPMRRAAREFGWSVD